jgi:hypothetical protein
VLTWSGLQTFYTDNTNDTGSANLTFGKAAMNRGYHKLVRAGNFDFPEYRTALTSDDGTYVYTLPPQFSKMKEVVWERTSQNTPLVEVGSLSEWDVLKYGTSTGDPSHYMVRKAAVGFNTWELWLYPTPADDDITIRVTYLRLVPNLSADDYTASTITVVNADATVTGAATTFTAAMVGRSILLPDGLWYDIASRTSNTVIELTYPYQGTGAAAQTYTLGEIPLLPEPHHDAIYAYAVAEYYMKSREKEDAAIWMGIFDNAKRELNERKNRTTNQIMYGNTPKPRSLNDYPYGPL